MVVLSALQQVMGCITILSIYCNIMHLSVQAPKLKHSQSNFLAANFRLDKPFCWSYTVTVSDIFKIVSIIITGFPERDWISFTGFSLYPKCFLALGVKVNDRPIRYFSGKFAMTSV